MVKNLATLLLHELFIENRHDDMSSEFSREEQPTIFFFFFNDYILYARKDYSQATFRIATYQSVSFDIVILTAS